MPENPSPRAYELPKLQPGIAEALLASAKEAGPGFFTELARQLESKNPLLYSSIAEFAQGSGVSTLREIKVAYNAMLMTYALLERQGEADALNQGIA